MPDEILERIALWRKRQMKERLPCPRCGLRKMAETPIRNATSRHADIYICDDCGMNEAMRDFVGSVLPLEEWACAKP